MTALVAAPVSRRCSAPPDLSIFPRSVAIRAAASEVTARAVSHPLCDVCNIFFDRIPDPFSGRKCFFKDGFPADVRRVTFRLLAVAIKEKPAISSLDIVEFSASPRVAWLVEFDWSAILVLDNHLLSVDIRGDAKIPGKNAGQDHDS